MLWRGAEWTSPHLPPTSQGHVEPKSVFTYKGDEQVPKLLPADQKVTGKKSQVRVRGGITYPDARALNRILNSSSYYDSFASSKS